MLAIYEDKQKGIYMKTTYDYSRTVKESKYAGNVYYDESHKALLIEHGDISNVEKCPYCACNISYWNAVEYPKEWYFDDPIDIELLLCNSCGWYRYRAIDWMDAPPTEVVNRIAILAKENIDDANSPINNLRRYLIKNWDDRKSISAQNAEELIAGIFKDHLNCEIRYTTNGVYTPDGGIDFVLVNTNKGIEYAFQIKRRLTDSPERIQPIREFIGAVAGTPFKHAYYVTTAERITKYAKKEMKRSLSNLKKRNIYLNIIDGNELFHILKSNIVTPSTSESIIKMFKIAKNWKLKDCQVNKWIIERYNTTTEYKTQNMVSLAFSRK